MSIFGSKEKEKQSETIVVEVEDNEPKLTAREERLVNIFGEEYLPKQEVCETNQIQITKGDTGLELNKAHNLLVFQPDKPAEVAMWLQLLKRSKWKDQGLKDLALDTLEGLKGSLELNLGAKQIELQKNCFIRTLFREIMTHFGFTPKEVRFTKEYTGGDWDQLAKTRTSLEKIEKQYDDDHDVIRTGQSSKKRYRVVFHNFTDSDVRISGKAFEAIKVLKRFPVGIIEDVWIAEKKGITDPMLVIQIGGHSYSIKDWDE